MIQIVHRLATCTAPVADTVQLRVGASRIRRAGLLLQGLNRVQLYFDIFEFVLASLERSSTHARLLRWVDDLEAPVVLGRKDVMLELLNKLEALEAYLVVILLPVLSHLGSLQLLDVVIVLLQQVHLPVNTKHFDLLLKLRKRFENLLLTLQLIGLEPLDLLHDKFVALQSSHILKQAIQHSFGLVFFKN